MAIIHGQVESLKKVKARLAEEGITQFSSIGEMNAFLANYDSRFEQIKNDVIDVYHDELAQINRKRERQLKLYIDLKNEENKKLNIELDNLRVKIDEIDKKGFFARFKRRKLSKQLRKQEREFDDIVSKRIADLEKEFQKANAQLHDFEKNQSNILEERINTAVNELRRTKRVVEDLSS